MLISSETAKQALVSITEQLSRAITSGADATRHGVGSIGRGAESAADALQNASKGFRFDLHSDTSSPSLPFTRPSLVDGTDPRRPLRVVTWNIAGGRRSRSTEAFDYDEVNLEYFAERIRRLRPDVVNVQESEIGPNGSTAGELAELLGYPHIFETGMCPSHMSNNKTLGIAVISRLPFDQVEARQLPVTRVELSVGGRQVEPYDRYAQRVTVGTIHVVNLHPTPLGFFGHSYEEGAGAEHAREIGSAVRDLVDGPTVVAADLNTDRPGVVYGSTFDELGMSAALEPGSRTVPGWDGAPDQIYSSRELRTVDRGIETTDSDHHLVWADLEVTDPTVLDSLASARETAT